MHPIENRTFDELQVGDSASLVRTLRRDDIELFAALSGDAAPLQLDAVACGSEPFHRLAAHGMWSDALLATLLATRLPGPGTQYLEQTLHYLRPVALDDSVTVKVTVAHKQADGHRVQLDAEAVNQRGECVVEGRVTVAAPVDKQSLAAVPAPELMLRHKGQRYRRLVAMAAGLAPLRTAVVHPVDVPSLLGAVEAAHAHLIDPLLIGPRARLEAAAQQAGVDLGAFECIDVEHSDAAAETAVELAQSGRVEALMKGALHTDELMHAVVTHNGGLRTKRRMSHVFAIDAPAYPRSLFVTDAAINIYPTLADKRDIVQNAIELVHALGIAEPRVAILSAVETVTDSIRSTLDAAALCKMADRGQIHGGILDGPLAFDNAVSPEAARTKGIVSAVAGRADIFVVPDLEAGNMLAKQLEYLGDAQMAGIVLGARVPIMLTSRADPTLARLGSCAIALLLARHAAEGRA